MKFLEDYKKTGNHSEAEKATLARMSDIQSNRNVVIETVVAADLKMSTHFYLNRQDVTDNTLKQIFSGQMQVQAQTSQVQNEQRKTLGNG